MGLTNASQQFQQLMEDRLQPVRDVADPYIDDIIVGTWVGPGEDLFEAHDRDVRRVLEILKRDEFIIRNGNFLFQRRSSVVISWEETKACPGKLRAIEKWEVPKTVTALRAFLGFTNYYSSYVKDSSKIVARLMDKSRGSWVKRGQIPK